MPFPNMKAYSFQLVIALTAAVVMSLLYYAFGPLRREHVTYNPRINEVADRDVIAPFTFPILKSDDQLRRERDQAAAQVETVWQISANRNTGIFKNLDAFFGELVKLYADNKDDRAIHDYFRQRKGFSLSRESISYLRDFDHLSRLQQRLSDEVGKVIQAGVYDEALAPGENLQLLRDGEVTTVPSGDFYTETRAKQTIDRRLSYGLPGSIVDEILGPITLVNVEPDTELMDRLQQEARNTVDPTMGTVEANEKIIEKNKRVTPLQYRKLQSMHAAEQQVGDDSAASRRIVASTLGVFLFLLVILGIMLVLMNYYFERQFNTIPRSILLVAALVFTMVAAALVHDLFCLQEIFVPVLFAPLFIAAVFGVPAGIVFNFFNFVAAAMFLNWNFLPPLQMTLAGMLALLLLRRLGDRIVPVQMLLSSLGAFLLVMFTVNLIQQEQIAIYISRFFWGGLSIIISVVLMASLAPFVKRKLKMATRQILLDLLDFNNALLKKLAETAPGTYSHSLMVGNLAESAADAIGANPLLARVGGYYHDIGKVESPEIFTENNPDSSKIHDGLKAEESSLRIRDHVSRGISLARRNHLPQAVIDILAQHHGTSQIRFFLDKAQKEGQPFDPGKFHYFGPRPQTKEAALVMIADIVESTIKSQKQTDEDAIRKVIDETVLRLIREGQLADAPITLKELETVKSYMLPILKGVYSKRIEYPDTETEE